MIPIELEELEEHKYYFFVLFGKLHYGYCLKEEITDLHIFQYKSEYSENDVQYAFECEYLFKNGSPNE